MTVDTNKTIFMSTMSGFGQYTTPVTLTSSVAGQTIPVGTAIGPIRATTALNNSNAISQILVNISGDSFYRVLPGYLNVYSPYQSAATYEMQFYSYYLGGLLYLDVWISNQTGAGVTIPAMTFAYVAHLFNNPT